MIDHVKVRELAEQQASAHNIVNIKGIMKGLATTSANHHAIAKIVDKLGYQRIKRNKRTDIQDKVSILKQALKEAPAEYSRSRIVQNAGLSVNSSNIAILDQLIAERNRTNAGIGTVEGRISRTKIEQLATAEYNKHGCVNIKEIQVALDLTPGGYYHTIISKIVDDLGYDRITKSHQDTIEQSTTEPKSETKPIDAPSREQHVQLLNRLNRLKSCYNHSTECNVELEKCREQMRQLEQRIDILQATLLTCKESIKAHEQGIIEILTQ